MSSSIQDSSIFDSKPLQRKNQKHQNQCRLKQKLEQSIDECLSQYMSSEIKTVFSDKFLMESALGNQQLVIKCLWQNNEQKENIFNQIKSLNQEISRRVKNNVRDPINLLTCSVVNAFENVLPQNQKSRQKSSKKKSDYISRFQLTESNKNFLIELFVEMGLLINYSQQDRSFSKLINEAQKRYYEVQEKIKQQEQNQSNINQAQENPQQVSPYSEKDEKSVIEVEVDSKNHIPGSTFYSTKKRLFQSKELQEDKSVSSFNSGQKVIGYSPSNSPSAKDPIEFKFEVNVEIPKQEAQIEKVDEQKKDQKKISVEQSKRQNQPLGQIIENLQKARQLYQEKVNRILNIFSRSKQIRQKYGMVRKHKPSKLQ